MAVINVSDMTREVSTFLLGWSSRTVSLHRSSTLIYQARQIVAITVQQVRGNHLSLCSSLFSLYVVSLDGDTFRMDCLHVPLWLTVCTSAHTSTSKE